MSIHVIGNLALVGEVPSSNLDEIRFVEYDASSPFKKFLSIWMIFVWLLNLVNASRTIPSKGCDNPLVQFSNLNKHVTILEFFIRFHTFQTPLLCE